MRDVYIRLQPATDAQRHDAPEARCASLAQGLGRLGTKPTQRGTSEMPVLPEACQELRRRSGLRGVLWTRRGGCAPGTPAGAAAVASVGALRARTNLRTLRIPFWPGTTAAEPVGAALAPFAAPAGGGRVGLRLGRGRRCSGEASER